MDNVAKPVKKRADTFGHPRNTGYCTICRSYGKLSADHIPPKGCIRFSGHIKDVIFKSFLPDERVGARAPLIQGGVKFHTICSECNSGLLGSKYDPALNKFAEDVFEQLKKRISEIHLPALCNVNIDTHRVARSLIGHLLAAHSVAETQEEIRTLGANESLREYLLNPTLPFPDGWRLYFWPYCGRDQVVFRHFVKTDLMRSGEPLYGHLVKFFPLAFWFVRQQPADMNMYLYEITPEKNKALDELTSICVNLKNVPHHLFPENPTGTEVILLRNDQGSIASPR